MLLLSLSKEARTPSKCIGFTSFEEFGNKLRVKGRMKKMIKLRWIALVLLVGCTGSDKSGSLRLFGDNTDIPKEAVYHPDNQSIYIIGQRQVLDIPEPTYTALVQLSLEGEVIAQKDFGTDKEVMRDIVLGPDGRLFLVGEKSGAVWIQEIDKELKVLADTMFWDMGSFNPWTAKLLVGADGFFLVGNTATAADGGRVDIRKLSFNFDQVWKVFLENRHCRSCNTESNSVIRFLDATIDSDGNLAIVGDGHPFKPHKDHNYSSDAFVALVDGETGDSLWFNFWGDGKVRSTAKEVIEHNGQLYVAGNRHTTPVVTGISKEGERLWQKDIGPKDHSGFSNDIIAAGGRVWVGGYDVYEVSEEYFYDYSITGVDADGVLTYKTFPAEAKRELECLLNLDDENVMLIGRFDTHYQLRYAWDIETKKLSDLN